ncbi:MAG: sortase [Anaerolineaceae bacterium]|nr:sortase [Anaerolineaceae bacterium]
MKKMRNVQRRIIKKLYFLVVMAVALALVTPAAAAPLPRPVTDQATGLLATHFGVTLSLLPPHDGGSYNSFDWDSFQPTLNTGTVDFTEGDWYGNWSETDPDDHSTIQHPSTAGTPDQDWYPSGGEWYDVEAMYFDNDANNIYVAIVTSVPFIVANPDFGTIAGVNATEVGVGDNRWGNTGDPRLWVRPGDLALSLFAGTARTERYGPWHYNYALDLVHEDRNSDQGHPLGWGSVEMRDTNLGAGFYETNYDAGGSDITGVAGFDWYASTSGSGRVPAGWEHTNFDPASPDVGLANYLGAATYVDYYEYVFPGGELENNARTYVIEATIPRSLFGANNPASGDSVGIRWVEGCRNDGNNTDRVLSLVGDIDDPFFSKSLDGTNQNFTPGLDVAIGEIISYQINVRVPGTSILNDLTITDTLSPGLAFVDCGSINDPGTGIVVEPNLVSNLPTGFTCNPDETVPTGGNPAVFSLGSGDENEGRQIVWRLGNVMNPDPVERTITIYYRAVVLDSLDNVRGVNTLRNQAVITWNVNDSETVTTPALTIVEPWFDLVKTVNQSVVNPGDIVTFQLTFEHDGTSNTNAYDFYLEDMVPDGLTYVPNSLDVIQGVPSTSENQNAGVSNLLPGVSGDPLLRADWNQILLGAATTVVEFQATLDAGTTAVTNSTAAAWTSLPGDVSAPQSAFNVLSHERNYDPGSNIDIYTVNDSITIGAPAGTGGAAGGLVAPAAGFAPGGMTLLPAQPLAQQYAAMGNVWLDVPSIDVQASILGIPRSGDTWDLTWLKGELGYLQGSAFPGWQGNTALTGHLTLADGKPGPFADLHALQIGDEITLHTWGDEVTYKVREVGYRVDASDEETFQHEDTDWLTLITCQSYDSLARNYRWRVVVRAERID